MGAMVAMRLAIDSPELVHALVLVAPVPASGAAFSEKGATYLRATVGDREAARKWLARTFHNEPEAEDLERLCEAAAQTHPTPRSKALSHGRTPISPKRPGGLRRRQSSSLPSTTIRRRTSEKSRRYFRTRGSCCCAIAATTQSWSNPKRSPKRSPPSSGGEKAGRRMQRP